MYLFTTNLDFVLILFLQTFKLGPAMAHLRDDVFGFSIVFTVRRRIDMMGIWHNWCRLDLFPKFLRKSLNNSYVKREFAINCLIQYRDRLPKKIHNFKTPRLVLLCTDSIKTDRNIIPAGSMPHTIDAYADTRGPFVMRLLNYQLSRAPA